MRIADIVNVLETWAPASLQESYDNAGLILGNPDWECRGVLCSLDATEAVVEEAIQSGVNLIVAHHPIIFSGLKRINGKNYVERTILKAIENKIAIYAIHTNLDNLLDGVNGRMADRMGLINRSILAPKTAILKKLYTFAPVADADKVRNALFDAGAGHIGRYSNCSFNSEGLGSFLPGEGTQPHVGQKGEMHFEKEVKLEVIFPAWLEKRLIAALKTAHPYEEVAYDIVPLTNEHQGIGAGLLAELNQPMEPEIFLAMLQEQFCLPIVRHTAPPGRPIQKVALCGGAGSFLISKALAAGADAFVTADLKYHEFFDAEGRLLLADIGHYESEQFTIDLLQEFLQQKFPTFAVLKTKVETNPVQYFQAKS
jgi:dinuclear metal center YbgI/SA1388 family protein